MDEKKRAIISIILFLAMYFGLNYVLMELVVLFPGYYQYLLHIFQGVAVSYQFLILFVIQEILLIILLFFSFKYLLLEKTNKTIGIMRTYFAKQFVWKGRGVFFKYVVGMFLLLILVNSLIMFAINYFNISLPGFYGEQAISGILGSISMKNYADYLIIFFVVTLFGPIVEELIYRGFITKILLEQLSAVEGIFLSAFIFAFIHFDWAVFGNLFILSLFLAYIYYKTRSLTYTFLFHFTINFIATLFLFLAPHI